MEEPVAILARPPAMTHDSPADPAVRLAAWRGDALLVARRVLGDGHLAEDAVQQAFVHALRAPAAIPAGDGARLWLIRIAANAAKDLAKTERRRREREAAVAGAATGAVAPEPTGDAGAKLRAALESLPAEQRLALSARYELDLPYGEAARALGVPSPLLRLRVSRGLARLRRRLARDHRDDEASAALGLLVCARHAALPRTSWWSGWPVAVGVLAGVALVAGAIGG